MVRGIHNLTLRACDVHIKMCERLGITRLLGDGGGLYLRATPTAAASWIYRFEQDGVGHEHGLGSYYTVTMDEVREAARECRKLVRDKKNPIELRRAALAAERAPRAI